jgi:outer membrane protein assembly factor BamA
VHYDFKYTIPNLTVVFILEEKRDLSECMFDNFIGVSDKELVEQIKKKLPSFNGKVPSSGVILQNITNILENYIKRNGDALHVQCAPFFDKNKSLSVPKAMVFSIEDDKKPPICKIAITGDDNEIAPVLESAAMKLMNTPFSRSKINDFGEVNFLKIFRNRGNWNFRIDSIESEKMSTPECPNGVFAKLYFKSGDVFTWSNVVWSGNNSIPSAELDYAFGLKTGDIASQEKIEAGFVNIRNAFFKFGFLDYYSRLQSHTDDINRKISYRANITESRQYRMGRFMMLPPTLNLPFGKLSSEWKIKEGVVFDGAYFEEFKEKSFKPWSEKYARNTKMTIRMEKSKEGIVNLILIPETPSQQMPGFRPTPVPFGR